MKLVLFFTKGVSLEKWDDVGLLEREAALYRKLQEKGIEITFITYGGKSDLRYADKLPGIRICCNRWGFSLETYERLIPLLHAYRLHKADLIKSNQTNGAEIACREAIRFRKPFIARCGYMWSKNVGLENGKNSDYYKQTLQIEKQVFTSANHIVVTTHEMVQSISERFPQLTSRISVIPNYVDTSIFKPAGENDASESRLCFVGRLAQEKNLSALLKAVDSLDVELDIIGQGPLRESLVSQARNNPRVHFHGRVPNQSLPEYLQKSTAFIFPSLYEGHPKTPIEAMSCALPVIATNVSGIRELIRHKETGWLCDVDSHSLREGIKTVLADADLRSRLAVAARKFVADNFSLEKVANLEIDIYKRALSSSHA